MTCVTPISSLACLAVNFLSACLRRIAFACAKVISNDISPFFLLSFLITYG
nr:MAG TPA: hypothetical protein [Caudoviricetes sp.]